MPVKCTPLSKFQQALKETDVKRTIFGGLGASMLSSPVTWTKNILFTMENLAVNRGIPLVSAALQKIPGVRKGAEFFLGGAVEDLGFTAAKIGVMAHLGRLSPLLRRHGVLATMANASAELGQNALSASRVGARELIQAQGGKGIAPGLREASEFVFGALQKGDEYLYKGEFAAQIWTRAANQASREGKKGSAAILKRASEIIEAETTRTSAKKTAIASKTKAFREKSLIDEVTDDVLNNNERATVDELTEEFTNQLNAEFKQSEVSTLSGISLDEAERSIFVAREAAWLDRVLDHADDLDNTLGGIVSTALPFRRTPANEAREFFRQSPGGLFTIRARMRALEAKGLDALTARTMAFDEISRVAIGTSALVGAVGLVRMGAATVLPFDRSKSQAERATEETAGSRTDTLQYGDHQISLNRLGLIGRYMKVAQDLSDAFDSQDGARLTKLGAAAQALTFDLGVGLAKEGFLDEMVQMIGSWGDPKKQARFARDFGGRFAPAIVRDVQKLAGKNLERRRTDPNLGVIESVVEGAKAGFGLESEASVARRNVFGTPQNRPSGPAGVLAGVTKRPTDRQTEFAQVLLDSGAPKEAPEGRVTGVPLNFGEQDTVAQARGRVRERLMIGRIGEAGSPQRGRFDVMPLEARKRIIDKVFRDAGRQVGDSVRVMKRNRMPITSATLAQRLRLQ